MRFLMTYDGEDQPGNPDKLAAAIVELVDARTPPLRLPLGTDTLKAILKPINYANLDAHAPFKGKGATTTEFLSRHIFDEILKRKPRGEALSIG